MGVIDRFRPYRPGKVTSLHYVLDEVGALVVAANRGIEVKDLDWRPGRAMALAGSSQLDHLVGVNGFFSVLYGAGRSLGSGGLVEWWSARRCAAEWGTFVIPDGFGVWRQDDVELQFFLEYDRGTESLKRLDDKVARYRKLMATMGSKTPVLFVLEGPRREAGLRRMTRSVDIPIATAITTEGFAKAIWYPHDGDRRVDLVELAHRAVAMDKP